MITSTSYAEKCENRCFMDCVQKEFNAINHVSKNKFRIVKIGAMQRV